VLDDTVRCPWHHACFDLVTDAALHAPALNAVASYEVARRQDSICVGPRKKTTARARTARGDGSSSVAIVGGGAAGNSTAETLRHLGFGRGGRVLAVATISRDRESMEAELAMEREIARA
jgi:hypothetical protein